MCILLNVKKHEKTFALNVDIFRTMNMMICQLKKSEFGGMLRKYIYA